MKNIFIIIFACCMITISSLTAYAYDSDYLHPEINEHAASQSSLDKVLSHQLNFPKGIETPINGKTIIKILRKAGSTEDNDPRWVNHFHNPLKSWETAGLLAPYSGYDSSIVWAQKEWQTLGGTYSWTTARDAYYQALTTNSENDYELTFRSLGQVMHLIADASVPAHVRNDAHLFGDTFEKYDKDEYSDWVDDHLDYSNLFLTEYYVAPSIFDAAVPNPSAPVPISALWDQDVYDGTNPHDTLNSLVGLAEYTNANFITEDTAFRYFPHPVASDTNYNSIDWQHPEIQDAEDGSQDNKIYIYHNAGHRLATVSYLTWRILVRYNILSNLLVDDVVLQDYASLLIPRAVGYSTALIDYFFRGEIEMGEGPTGGYTISNNSGENMSGTFALYYDDKNGDRYPVEGAEWNLSIPAHSNGPDVFFTAPDSYEFKKPYLYVLVFNGTLGNEDGAVVGKEIFLFPGFLFTLEWEKDNSPIQADLSVKIYNAEGTLLPSESVFNSDTQMWEVRLLNNYHLYYDGYFIEYYYGDTSISTQYPHRYKKDEKKNAVDLIEFGQYSDSIPYFEIGPLVIDPWPLDEDGYIWCSTISFDFNNGVAERIDKIYESYEDREYIFNQIGAKLIKEHTVRSTVPFMVHAYTRRPPLESDPTTCHATGSYEGISNGSAYCCYVHDYPLVHLYGAGIDVMLYGYNTMEIPTLDVYKEFPPNVNGTDIQVIIENIAPETVIREQNGEPETLYFNYVTVYTEAINIGSITYDY